MSKRTHEQIPEADIDPTNDERETSNNSSDEDHPENLDRWDTRKTAYRTKETTSRKGISNDDKTNRNDTDPDTRVETEMEPIYEIEYWNPIFCINKGKRIDELISDKEIIETNATNRC